MSSERPPWWCCPAAMSPPNCSRGWWRRALSRFLASGRCHVAEHLPPRADEDDAVSGRVAGVKLHFLVRHRNAAAHGDVRDGTMSGDDGDVVIALDLEPVGLIGVGFAAARQPRMVRLL